MLTAKYPPRGFKSQSDLKVGFSLSIAGKPMGFKSNSHYESEAALLYQTAQPKKQRSIGRTELTYLQKIQPKTHRLQAPETVYSELARTNTIPSKLTKSSPAVSLNPHTLALGEKSRRRLIRPNRLGKTERSVSNSSDRNSLRGSLRGLASPQSRVLMPSSSIKESLQNMAIQAYYSQVGIKNKNKIAGPPPRIQYVLNQKNTYQLLNANSNKFTQDQTATTTNSATPKSKETVSARQVLRVLSPARRLKSKSPFWPANSLPHQISVKSVPYLITENSLQKTRPKKSSLQPISKLVLNSVNNNNKCVGEYNNYYYSESSNSPSGQSCGGKSAISNSSSTLNSKKRKPSLYITEESAIPEEDTCLIGLESCHKENQNLSHVFRNNGGFYIRASEISASGYQQSQINYKNTCQQESVVNLSSNCLLVSGGEAVAQDLEGMLNLQSCIANQCDEPAPLSKKVSHIALLKSEVSNEWNIKNVVKKIETHLATIGLVDSYTANPERCYVSPSYELLCEALAKFHYEERVKVEMALSGDARSCFKLRNIEITDPELRCYLKNSELKKLQQKVQMENNILKGVDSVLAGEIGNTPSQDEEFKRLVMQLLLKEYEFLQQKLNKENQNAGKRKRIHKRIVETMLLTFLFKELSAPGNSTKNQFFSESSCTSLEYKDFSARWGGVFEYITAN